MNLDNNKGGRYNENCNRRYRLCRSVYRNPPGAVPPGNGCGYHTGKSRTDQSGEVTIQDDYIEEYLAHKDLDLTATLDAEAAYKDADFVVIAAPTNYDSKKNFFDTSAVEDVIKLVIQYNPEAIMVIKSTIPVGFTVHVREKYHCDNIIFSPEFLRESKALYDNLYPSRIIVWDRRGERKDGEGGIYICCSFTGRSY